MAAIASKNTTPELRLRSVLHSRGWRYRLHAKDLPGTPDIIFRSRRVAIFVNGCFWHSHDCRFGTVTPRTRPEFWAAKRSATVARDARKTAALIEMGWKVLVVWECKTKNIDAAIGQVEECLRRLDGRTIKSDEIHPVTPIR